MAHVLLYLACMQALAAALKVSGLLQASWLAVFFPLWGTAVLITTAFVVFCALDWSSQR